MSNEKWTADAIPDQSGRVAIVTGANSGLGLETARALAGRGASVVLAVRNLEKGEEAVDAIRADHPGADLEMQQLDLASLDSIREAASEIRGRVERIDLLINNAGVMYTPRLKTADGFEMQFGTNHLGHFAWTGQLLELLLGVEGSRVVTVSSVGHKFLSRLDFDDLQAERRYNRVAAYGRSKLANLYFTYELQRRLRAAGAETVAMAAHPGGSDTELGRHIPGAGFVRPSSSQRNGAVFRRLSLLGLMAQSAAMGALPTLRAATDPSAEGGQYYGPDGFMESRGHPVVVASSDRSHNTVTQRRLWAASEELTAASFPV